MNADMNTNFQKEKAVVRNYYATLARVRTFYQARDVFSEYLSPDLQWYGVYPYGYQTTRDDVIDVFWKPFYNSWSHIQRREDIFFAGKNIVANQHDEVWTLSMGHYLGYIHKKYYQIPSFPGMAFLRYAEFNCIKDRQIVKSAFFCDMIDLMHQAGLQPLPISTGTSFLYPGPRTHDGLLYEFQNPASGLKTISLVNRMIEDLAVLNNDPSNRCPPEILRKTWHKNMIWYGPAGIGASYTIPQYQKGHQRPFRRQLKNKVFHGHICRLAEGNYAGFFGWPNLSNTPTGGFLGLPENEHRADMRVVDVYRREGNKLSENWVIIDIPHWLLQQGLDIFNRIQ